VWLVTLAVAGRAYAQADRYVVSPGDVLTIQVWAGGEKQEEFNSVVSSERSIMIPLAGTVPVNGLSATGVGTRLRQLLSRGYYVNPQVLVSVKDYGGKVTVLGEVRNPGIYPLGQGLTALTACALAGGPTDFAGLHNVKLVRTQGRSAQQYRIDLARIRQGKDEDPMLMAGDRLDVPRRLF
jgi:polysaccharide export outer membrane protein